MLQAEHSAILLTFIKLPFVINIFVLSISKWPVKTGFTVVKYHCGRFGCGCCPFQGSDSVVGGPLFGVACE